MVRAGELKIRVADPSGNALDGAAVLVEPTGESSPFVNPRSLRLEAMYANDRSAMNAALDRLHRTDLTGFLAIGPLPAGRYRIKVRHPDYRQKTVDVRVTAGNSEPIRVQLD